MRALAVVITLALAAPGCVRQPTPPVPAPADEPRGAIQVSVDPNPILARNSGGSSYEFPFSLTVSEVGGVAVAIERVGVEVKTIGGLTVYSMSMTADDLSRRGYPTAIPAFGALRYNFSPRKDVPDPRLFERVWAELSATGSDTHGTPMTTRTRVTVEVAQ